MSTARNAFAWRSSARRDLKMCFVRARSTFSLAGPAPPNILGSSLALFPEPRNSRSLIVNKQVFARNTAHILRTLRYATTPTLVLRLPRAARASSGCGAAARACRGSAARAGRRPRRRRRRRGRPFCGVRRRRGLAVVGAGVGDHLLLPRRQTRSPPSCSRRCGRSCRLGDAAVDERDHQALPQLVRRRRRQARRHRVRRQRRHRRRRVARRNCCRRRRRGERLLKSWSRKRARRGTTGAARSFRV